MSDQEPESDSEYTLSASLDPTKNKPQQFNNSSIQKFRDVIKQLGIPRTKALLANVFGIETDSYSPPPLEEPERPTVGVRRPRWKSGDDLPSLNEFYSNVEFPGPAPTPVPGSDPNMDAVNRAIDWSLKHSMASTFEPVTADDYDPWDYKEIGRDPWDYNETRQQITDSFARFEDRNVIRSPRSQFLKTLCGNLVAQIAFLQGIVDYHEIYEVYPCENAVTMRNFRENWIQVDFSDIELSEQILMMHKKFSRIGGRAFGSLGKMREDERRFLCLGQRIWGNDVQIFDSDDEQMEKVKNAATRPESDMKKKLKIGGS